MSLAYQKIKHRRLYNKSRYNNFIKKSLHRYIKKNRLGKFSKYTDIKINIQLKSSNYYFDKIINKGV